MEACQKHIIDIEKDLFPGHNCLLASLKCITEHYGCKYSETQLFFISNGFQIRYANNLNYIGRYTTEGVNIFGKRTLIPVTMRRRDPDGLNPEEMVHELKSSMLLLSVDTKHLSYHKSYMENENRQHAIILYGLDLNEKSAHIIDLYILDYWGSISVYRGKISFEEMFAATFRYSFFCFDNKKDLSESEILQYAYTDFREFIRGSENGHEAIGSLALKRYLTDILKLEETDNRDLASICSNINYNIKIRSFNNINKYLEFFLEENPALKRRGNEELLDRIKWHMVEWEKVGLAILRIGISKRKSNLAQIYEKSIQLFDSQMHVYNLFFNLLEDTVLNR
jgi:regulator of replication initiation timing